MRLDRDSDRPMWKQVADFVRAQITSGEVKEGEFLRSAKALGEDLGVGRDTVQQAMQELNYTGLISTDRARGGSWVRMRPKPEDLKIVRVPRGTRISSRMPSEPERQERGLEPGVPLLVVDRGPSYTPRIEEFPSNQVVIVAELDQAQK